MWMGVRAKTAPGLLLMNLSHLISLHIFLFLKYAFDDNDFLKDEVRI